MIVREMAVLFFLLALRGVCRAATPTAIIEVASTGVKVRATASGGRLPASRHESHSMPLSSPSSDHFLDGCDLSPPNSGSGAILSARSPNCSFSDRATSASAAGYSVVVVYETVEGIYRNRSSAEDKADYDCAKGESWVRRTSDKFSGFADSECAKSCDSGRCLLTGNPGQVCCAWDTYLEMGGEFAIPALFVRMADYDILSSVASEVYIYEPLSSTKTSSSFWSSIGVWALGVATCAYAARRGVKTVSSSHPTSEDDEEEPSLELSTIHAFGFVCAASTALLVLFYVDAYNIVVVAFAISGASSSAKVAFRPLVKKFEMERPSVVDGVSACLGIAASVWWLAARRCGWWVASWMLQDFFGVCLCIVFLEIVKLKSLKVATVLLSMAFVYDVFFVFASPYFFGQSVMVKVATGSGPRKGADFCEKYPSDPECSSTELPMLLLLPSRQGFSMLGLGDVVIPGLLVALAARCDDLTKRTHYYYPVLVAAYAFGLALANLAVSLFRVGQPALLYIVPVTLGTFLLKAKHDKLLRHFWNDSHLLLQQQQQDNDDDSIFSPPHEDQALLKLDM